MNPLANNVFRRLFMLRSISFIGTGLATLALIFKAYSLSHQYAGIVLGVALVIKMIAYITMAPLFSHYLQRYSKKYFLVAMDLARGILLISMLWMTHIWQVYVIIFLVSACAAGSTPIYQALMSKLLPDEKTFTRAVSLNQIITNIQTLVTPAIAAVLLLFLSYNVLFSMSAVAFLLCALGFWSMSLPSMRTPSDAIKSVKLFHGIRSFLKNYRLLGALCLLFPSTLAGATVIINSVVFFHGMAHLSESMVAIAMGIFGCGAVSCAILIPRLRNRFPDTRIMISGVVLLLLAFSIASIFHHWIWLLLIWPVLGVGTIAVDTPISILVNKDSTEHDRSALFAGYFSLTHVCWLVSYLLVGLFGEKIILNHYFTMLSVLALLSLLAGAGCFFLWRRARLMESTAVLTGAAYAQCLY